MEDKERTLNYFTVGGKIILSMDEVFRDMQTSVRVALTKVQAEKLLDFLQQVLWEDGYKFVPDPRGFLACGYCAFSRDDAECNSHPCTPDEREDGQDGHWEKARQKIMA